MKDHEGDIGLLEHLRHRVPEIRAAGKQPARWMCYIEEELEPLVRKRVPIIAIHDSLNKIGLNCSYRSTRTIIRDLFPQFYPYPARAGKQDNNPVVIEKAASTTTVESELDETRDSAKDIPPRDREHKMKWDIKEMTQQMSVYSGKESES